MKPLILQLFLSLLFFEISGFKNVDFCLAVHLIKITTVDLDIKRHPVSVRLPKCVNNFRVFHWLQINFLMISL